MMCDNRFPGVFSRSRWTPRKFDPLGTAVCSHFGNILIQLKFPETRRQYTAEMHVLGLFAV